jgi:hypothetical protein
MNWRPLAVIGFTSDAASHGSSARNKLRAASARDIESYE